MANNSGSRLARGLWLLCIGCVLIAIGLSLGGRWNAPNWWPLGDRGFRFEWKSGPNASGDAKGPMLIQDIAEQEGTFSTDITSLDVDLKIASFAIIRGEKAGYRLTGFGKDDIAVRVDGHTVRVEEKRIVHSLNIGDNFVKPLVEITIPEGTKFTRCAVKMGAGTVTVESLSVGELSIESGAGPVTIDKTDADGVRVKSGAGNLEISGCRFGDTELETAAGRIAIEADLGNKTRISTGAGAMELSLPGTADDWRFDFTRGVGVVTIGNETYTGVGNGSAGNPNAAKRIEIENGFGAVTVNFTH